MGAPGSRPAGGPGMMWAEAHRPASVAGMVGNEEARDAVMRWLAGWRRGTRPVLLAGPPGTGKTTLAALAARQHGYDLIGLDASDARGRARISAVLGPALGSAGLAGSPLIFVDEVDGIHGRADFGGAEALIRVLKEPSVPIILAANDASSAKMRAVAKAADTVEFRPVPPRLMRVYLRRVLALEGARLSPGAEVRAVAQSRGDMRAMLNAAQHLATGFAPAGGDARARLPDEAAVAAFFAAPGAAGAREALRAMEGGPRERIGALYSSVASSRLQPAQAARMMRAISDADLIHGRILRTQQWRLLRYLDAALAGAHEPGAKVAYSRYGLPWPLLSRLRWDGRAMRDALASLGARAHMSGGRFGTLVLPYLLRCVRDGTVELDPDDPAAAAVAKEAAR